MNHIDKIQFAALILMGFGLLAQGFWITILYNRMQTLWDEYERQQQLKKSADAWGKKFEEAAIQSWSDDE